MVIGRNLFFFPAFVPYHYRVRFYPVAFDHMPTESSVALLLLHFTINAWASQFWPSSWFARSVAYPTVWRVMSLLSSWFVKTNLNAFRAACIWLLQLLGSSRLSHLWCIRGVLCLNTISALVCSLNLHALHLSWSWASILTSEKEYRAINFCF